MGHQRAPRAPTRRCRGEPCQVQPSWKAPPPAGTSTGTSSGSTPSAAAAWRSSRCGSSGPWNSSIIPQRRVPAVRAAHVLDRALGGGRVLEGDPAADPLGGVGPLLVTRVLVEPERLATGWLPQHVVLAEPDSRPPAQPGAGAPDVGSQHHPGDVAVGLPGVADLAGQVGRAHAGAPVPFVGVQARLEVAGEELLVALEGAPGQRRDR